MRYFLFIIWLLVTSAALVASCAKYESKKATPNSQLTNHYCNDPNAVNYNWGFPGIPDNSLCYYPTDIFSGKWQYVDSVSIVSSGLFIYADSLVLTITKVTDSQMTVSGLCGKTSTGTILFTATPLFTAYADTLVTDSVTYGQTMCINQDTVTGGFTKNILYDSVMTINLTVYTDTGVANVHEGTAYKIQ